MSDYIEKLQKAKERNDLIRSLYASGKGWKELSEMFGISRQRIYVILDHKTWCSAGSRDLKTTEESFWAMANIGDENECWEWNGALNKQGYAVVTRGARTVRAYRLAWEIHNKQKIPTGMCACHKCDNRRCINPHHIFIGTTSDNIKDMWGKGRGWSQKKQPE